jgi:acyl-CoA synthetase (AMP-forming)/AMP-acid ligase II
MDHRKPARTNGPQLPPKDAMIWIGEIPAIGSQRHAERAAIVFADADITISYTTLEQRSNAFAERIRKQGYKPGDRIAYLGKNSDLYFPVLFGAIRADVVVVPLNWRLTAAEIEYQLADSQSLLLIHDPDLQPLAAQASAALAKPPQLLPTTADSGNDHLKAWLTKAAAAQPTPHDYDQVILQIYTSGTTGRPKGVLISHGAVSVSRHAELTSPDFGHYGADHISLSAMPNFHMGGMSWMLMALVRFGSVVLTADPSPANLLKLLREHRAQYSFIVPTAIRAIVEALRSSTEPAPAMKGIFYGAMPMSESLLRESMELFGSSCAFLQFFGMTEIAGSATYLSPADHDPSRPALLKSVGKPYPGMSLEIRDAEQRVCAAGVPGEIWIQSPTIMLGYWNLPQKTAEAVIDGWYASGDGGYLDEGGFLFLTDRIKDMIVSGGENVYPAEVEEALRQHPAVLDAAVVGVPDARWGESVAAVIELREGQQVGEEALRRFARDHIAGYKCPKAIRFVDALPRTASGKVKRAELRQQLSDALKRD